MTQQDDNSDKIVNLAQARKKQRTVQERSPRNTAKDGYDAALRKQKQGGAQAGKAPPTSLGKRVGAVVQLILFLGVCYLFLRTCQGF